MSPAVLDVAGGGIGGAARWTAELDGFLADHPVPVRVVGRGRQLTPRWLARRELGASRARVAVAANNASFAFAGVERRVVLRNALHFLRPGEHHLLSLMPARLRAQILVVRRLCARADTIVVPSSAMADRVCQHLPGVGARLVIRPHPVTPVGYGRQAPEPFVLVPVLPAAYKALPPELARLLAALDRLGGPLGVWVTARAQDLPTLAGHPRLRTLGTLPHHALAPLWQQATAAFFPTTVEAFGYPLAEARVYGVPVLAPDTTQAREVAGAALLPYRRGDQDSLVAAVQRCQDPVPAQPRAFDRDEYFRWLLALPSPNHPQESHDRFA